MTSMCVEESLNFNVCIIFVVSKSLGKTHPPLWKTEWRSLFTVAGVFWSMSLPRSLTARRRIIFFGILPDGF